jgi:hypothetical protein
MNFQDREEAKNKIIDLFNKFVRGKSSDTNSSNQGHDGKDGHWLETQMGIKHNSSNESDIYGFEMKNHTSSKTTFGDWSPDFALFKGKDKVITRDQFLKIFGSSNPKKNGRYSWSGKTCPKIDVFNDFGQKLIVDKYDNILAVYSFSKDNRADKNLIVPSTFHSDYIVITSWSNILMKKRVENKFNNFGWFKCSKNDEGVYDKIVFGNPITFNDWIIGVRSGLIFFDSGMYQGNERPYSQWRAENKYWDSLVKESF